ncbi:uncharacterized protein B0I36DRAFT_398759 [Microdochium trichocladiopsis]|uniref:Uncharacterized protein n=1 Tax=Microdochium trichocladiopsis TaxID=1682393 RepID=A0A9P9BHW3_9PEZI|nr:uncharacterized protein B0I36DRAFT_398759 [Microdochium trichocladiopsis]KAH7012457.1 hypothetical protein B0I36DRAFT_398759 [Microdochium trichocladiopsis]
MWSVMPSCAGWVVVAMRTGRNGVSRLTRKVRCDKAVPCLPCSKRGEADACMRETVIVRGQVTTARDSTGSPSYDELTQEVQRLRPTLSETTAPESHGAPPLSRALPYVDHSGYEQLLLHTGNDRPACSTLISPDEIILPSRACSQALIAYDRSWNSWVHYGVEYPAFEEQHARFLESLAAGAARCCDASDIQKQ